MSLYLFKTKNMTLEDYKAFERELSGQKLDVRSFLKSKNVKPNQYYYWKRKYNDQQESVDQLTGQFFPINVLPSGSRRVSKSGKNLKQPLISQGEIEIELRTASGAELRIRGMLDAVMLSSIIASSGGTRNV